MKSWRTYLYEIKRELIARNRWNALIKIISKNNYKSMVEIGVSSGINVFHIRKAHPKIAITGVDPYFKDEYDGYQKAEEHGDKAQKSFDKLFRSVLKKCKQRKIKIMRMTSTQAAKHFPDNSLDLVFIDALHTYKDVNDDIDAWYPKIRPGGTVSGHDYSIKYMGVVRAVNERFGEDNIAVECGDVWAYHKPLKAASKKTAKKVSKKK